MQMAAAVCTFCCRNSFLCVYAVYTMKGSLGVTGKVEVAKLLLCDQEVTVSSLGNSLWQKCKVRLPTVPLP